MNIKVARLILVLFFLLLLSIFFIGNVYSQTQVKPKPYGETQTIQTQPLPLKTPTVSEPPKVTFFKINNGAVTTSSRTVTLNYGTERASQYRASQRSDFYRAQWRSLVGVPQFTLSSGDGIKRVYFQVRNPIGKVSSVVSDTINLYSQAPRQYILRFSDAYLLHSIQTGQLQIAAQSTVLSYCSNWERKQMQPYLFHLRNKVWRGFYWKVDTSQKKVFKVTGGTFGGAGGESQLLDINLSVLGDYQAPRQYILRFSDAYLLHSIQTGQLQIAAQSTVLSYCSNWERKQMQPYLFHLRNKVWRGFYWKVDTSQKKVFKVTGGTFGGVGGESQLLDIIVQPQY